MARETREWKKPATFEGSLSGVENEFNFYRYEIEEVNPNIEGYDPAARLYRIGTVVSFNAEDVAVEGSSIEAWKKSLTNTDLASTDVSAASIPEIGGPISSKFIEAAITFKLAPPRGHGSVGSYYKYEKSKDFMKLSPSWETDDKVVHYKVGRATDAELAAYNTSRARAQELWSTGKFRSWMRGQAEADGTNNIIYTTVLSPVEHVDLIQTREDLKADSSWESWSITQRIEYLAGVHDQNIGTDGLELKRAFKRTFRNLYTYESKLKDYVVFGNSDETTIWFNDPIKTEDRFSIPTFFFNGYSLSDITAFKHNWEKDPDKPIESIAAKQAAAEKKRKEQEAEKARVAKILANIKVSEQAILLHNLKELAQQSIKSREEQPYDNFACIDVKRDNNVSDFATMMTTQKDAASIFERLKPVHISSMMPVVRVFGYANSKRDAYEYEFEEFSDLTSTNGVLGTSTGVNMTSFSWNFRGETPFLADRSIDCDMSLRAQSVDDLEKKYIYGQGKEDYYKFSNLFLPFDSEEKAKARATNEVEFTPRKVRTRAKIQYKIDEKSPVWKSDPDLAKAVKNMTVELELQLVHHSIDLNQDGTMKVDVRFIGRYDAETKDNDTSNTVKEQTEKQPQTKANGDNTEELQRLKKELAKAQSAPDRQDDVGQKRIADLQKKINKLQEEPIVDASSFDRKRPFLSLMKKIYQKRGLSVAQANLETLALTANQTDTSLANSLKGEIANAETPQQAADILKKRKKRIEGVELNEKFASATINVKYIFLGDIMEAAMESYIENSNLPNENSQEIRDTRVILGPIQFQKNFYDSSTGQGFQIKYNSKKGKLEFASAEAQGLVKKVEDLRALPQRTEEQQKQLKESEKLLEKIKSEQVTERVICNIADLPISLNYFNEFLTKNFLETGKTKLSFDEFVKTVVDQLVPRTLQYETENMLLPRVDSKVIRGTHSAYTEKAAPFADKLGFKYEGAPFWKPEFKGNKKRAFLEDLLSDGSIPLVAHEEHDSKGRRHMADYLFIYGEQMSYEKSFNKAKDHKNGIYHLEVGKDAGVVKEIKFSVIDDQAFQSFVLQRALKNQENIRKRVYDATVELQGITFFRPGQKVFLNPSAYGDPRNLKAFGLLGYYTVITVGNVVEEGQYKTSLDCKFHSWPKLGGEK